MPVDLQKVAADLACDDQEVRILALTTVVQLRPGSLLSPGDLPRLEEGLERAAESGDPDTVFLARKGLNHLRGLKPAAAIGAPARAPALDAADARAALSAGGDDPVRLAESLAVLVRAGVSAGDLPLIEPHLAAADHRVRANAVEAVEATGETEAVVRLLAPLIEDPHHRVQANANKALGAVGHPAVLSTLAAMASSGHLAQREASVYAMSFLKGPEVVALLGRCLRDPYEGIRLRAVRALGRHKDPAALPALREAMNDVDIDVCEEAARVVRFISMESAQPLREGYEDTALARAAAAERGAPPPGAEEGADARRRRELRALLGQKVFVVLRRQGAVPEALKRPFYDITKAQEFLAKQRQRAAGGELSERDAGEVRGRIEASIEAALARLAGAAEALEAAGRFEIPAAPEVRAELRKLDAALGEEG